MKKNQRGITLIALIITIVILLILAVVAISAVTNQDSAKQHLSPDSVIFLKAFYYCRLLGTRKSI